MNSIRPIVKMSNVSKAFGRTQALEALDLSVYPGRIIGLLGANGAGKSTVLRTIIGLYLPDSGDVRTFGRTAKDLGPSELARIGYVHQEGGLLDWMTAGQLIRYVSAYYPNWNHELERKYVADFEIGTDARVGSLSPGERQKLAILIAIGFEPELLILDEPASALDPLARARFLDLLLELIQTEGRTIIISSHILSDVEKVIDHVVIMDRGRILRDCSFDDLRERYCRVRLTSLAGPLPERLPLANVLQCRRSDGEALVTVRDSSLGQLQEQVQALDCQLDVQSLPLEDLYRLVMEGG
jgi:ABC-2 type transport system ATP-binding protein